MSLPVILAADTALGACSVALVQGDAVVAARWQAMERGHAEALAPMAQAVMAESGIAFAAIDRLAVTTGPGTFTGQRVGLAFMRGLRVALGKPLTGITTLAAMAAAAGIEAGLTASVALHDARRGEVYAQAVGLGRDLAEPVLLPFSEIIARIAHGSLPFAVAGTAAEAAAAALPGLSMLSTVRAPDARFVARLALAEAPAPGPPRPLYLRPPDAKLPGAAA